MRRECRVSPIACPEPQCRRQGLIELLDRVPDAEDALEAPALRRQRRMVAGCVGTQLAHVAENRKTARRFLGEGLQRRHHTSGVRVVALVDDGYPRNLGARTATARDTRLP